MRKKCVLGILQKRANGKNAFAAPSRNLDTAHLNAAHAAHLFGDTLRGDTRLVNALSHEARVPAMTHTGSQAQAHEATPLGVFPRREIPRARKHYRLHAHAPARAPILAAKPRRAFAKRD